MRTFVYLNTFRSKEIFYFFTQNVQYLPVSLKYEEISCTAFYLIQNFVCEADKNTSYVFNVTNYQGRMVTESRCNFSRMLATCFVQNATSKTTDLTLYDFIYTTEMLEFIGSIIIFPIISALGFFLNIFMVMVINHKPNRTKILQDQPTFRFYQDQLYFQRCRMFSFHRSPWWPSV